MERLAAGSLAVARSRCTELSIVKHVWRVVLVMLLAVFCVDGWSSIPEGCNSETMTCNGALGYGTCNGACHCTDPYHCQMDQSAIVGKKYEQTTSLGVQEYCVVKEVDANCRDIGTTRVGVTCCVDRCARERIQCELKGWEFDEKDCSCREPCDQTMCDNYRTQCDQMQGDFTGQVTRTISGECCCVANCNTCSKASLSRVMEQKKKECCGQNLAPPEDVRQCAGLLEGGCGMHIPVLSGNTGTDWACRDPNLSDNALQSFVENCYGSSSSGASSSSGTGGSSGGGTSDGGGSSGTTPPPYPEGCDECPWLDSILDTLTAQKGVLEAVYNCMSVPYLCTGEEQTSDPFQFDTAWYNYVKPLLDTSLHLDTLTLVELEKLDTNMLKMLENDLEKLKNDTLLRYSLTAGFTQNSSDLVNVRNEVNHMNDSTRKWLKRLADSLRVFNDSNRTYLDRVADTIGISTDSLIAHLDSIKRNIPRDVLDSILKYQKMLAESEDSVVLGSLPSIDSLIDSTVKYFKQAREFDSIRHVQMSDSLQALHEAIDGMSYRISQILGYGDTASTDLRGDLNSINSSVNTFRDSVIKYYGAFVSADSSYHVTFKDSVGSVHGTLNEIRDSLNGVSDRIVDGVVSGVVRGVDSVLNAGDANVQMGYLDFPSGDSLADLIGRDAGFNKLDVAGDTAALNAAINAPLVETDSTTCVGDDCIHYDSDKKIGDSLQNVIQRYGDSIKASNESFYRDSMTSLISQVKDSIVAINPFGVFDSTLMKTLGAKVPNTNTCPEHCSHWFVGIPFPFGVLQTDINYRLCVPWGVLGNLNVLQFLRFLIRCIVAVTCITMVMSAVAKARGGY